MFGNWRFGSTRVEKELESGGEEEDVHWSGLGWNLGAGRGVCSSDSRRSAELNPS